jgi:nitrogenase-stabilizing/protective protein
MPTIKEFNRLSSCEDFFDFFDLDFDARLVNSKRFHILKRFSDICKSTPQVEDEEKILLFYKFALTKVYKDFEVQSQDNSFSTAAEIWNMFDKPSGCLVCSTGISNCSSGNFSNDASCKTSFVGGFDGAIGNDYQQTSSFI